jgi:hypothetical protein
MTHDQIIRDMMSDITTEIAQALNQKHQRSDYAVIKSCNRLNVYHDMFEFEIVVRLPMGPTELESHRRFKQRMAELRAKYNTANEESK